MLFFKAKFLPLIRAGRKTQTLRYWTHARVKTGQLAYVAGLGRLRISAVEKLSGLASLTRADAVADGFASRKALLAELRQLYPVRTSRSLWRIRFTWNPRLAAAPSAAPNARSIQRAPRRSARRPAKRPAQGPAQAREALRRFVLERAPSPGIAIPGPARSIPRGRRIQVESG